jgi:hypothetical protein
MARWLLTLLVLACACARAADIEGVRIDDQVTLPGGEQLLLNGAGVRHHLMVVKLYIGALYLPERMSSAREILKDTGAKRLAMHVLVNEIPAKQLIASMNNSLAVNLSQGDLALIESRLADLNRMMLKVGMLHRGAVVTLTYVPASGTRISVNGDELLVVKGEEFFRALLHIWIGDKPVDGRLKSSMLGGSSGFRMF